MQMYKNQYGTVYAVRDYKGNPQIMCRAKDSNDWLVSETLAVEAAAAKTMEDTQAVLDSYAQAHDWTPVEGPASKEPPEIMDEGSAPDVGFPDWVRPMAAAFLQFEFVRALPTFTAAALRNSEPVRHNQGGSIADEGLYDTGPKGIKFTVILSIRYLEKYYTWPDFVRRCKAAGLAPEPLHKGAEDVPCNTEPAPTAPASLPAFDYSGLDDQTVRDLHLAEREYAGGKRMAEMGLRRMADGVAIAHDALCVTIATKCRNGNGAFSDSEKTFGRWCESVGLNRKAAERLLQVSKLFDNSTPREQKVLKELGPSLLYAAAKPSAPPELVQAVKDRDITTAKEFRELEAELKAERAAREKAEKDARAMKDGYSVAKKNEEFTLKNLKAAERERDEALKQRDGARDALQAAKLRGDKLKAENDALKAQPVEAKVIDEEEVDRRAKARAAELTAPLREELEALRNRHPADPEAAEQAIRDAYDSTIYTGRVIENAWHTLRPLLPCMDAERRDLAIRQLSKTIATIQGEIAACL